MNDMNDVTCPPAEGAMPSPRRRSLRPRHVVASVLAASITLGTVAVVSGTADAAKPMASADLETASGDRIGSVSFFDRGPSTRVEVKILVPDGTTATRAFHGFHIHANDKPENGEGCLADPAAASSTWFASADGHLKVDGENHADHVGDMPSLLVNANGSAETTFSTDRIAPDELDGRAVILHAGADNFGNVPVGGAVDQYSANSPDAVTKTAATGNAGDRFACGVVELR